MTQPATLQQRTIERVLAPSWRYLPHHSTWATADRRPYVDNLPDILAGLLRQFSTRMLDLGKLGIDDRERFAIYRSQVFDTRDVLQAQLREWLTFLTVVDAFGELDGELRELLLTPVERAVDE